MIMNKAQLAILANKLVDANTSGTSSPTSNNVTNNDEILDMLYKAFAEECMAWYQYFIVSKFMVGYERKNIESLFDVNADDELNDHAVKILNRISELGGDISYISSPASWFSIGEAEYMLPNEPYDVVTLLEQNVQSEQFAIERYKMLIEITKDTDPTTYTMAKEILADEETHLRDLVDYLDDIDSIISNEI